jgi:AcrR family transcriptional regulator
MSGISRRRASALSGGGSAYKERRQRIIEAAADVFQEMGFDRANLGDIASAVGADRASLYYYVSSKEELFLEVVHSAAEESVQRAKAIQESDAPTRDKIAALIESLMISYEEHYPYLFVYVQERMKQTGNKEDEWAVEMWDLNRRYDDAVEAIVQEGLDRGHIQAIAPARVIAYGIVGMVNWTHRWFRPSGGMSAAEIGQAYADLVLTGLLTPPARKGRADSSALVSASALQAKERVNGLQARRKRSTKKAVVSREAVDVMNGGAQAKGKPVKKAATRKTTGTGRA